VDSGFYAACAGLVAKTKALDAAAHDLANVGTTAFKGQRVAFRSLLANFDGHNLSAVNRSLNDFGVANTPSLNLTQGPIESTGNPLDLAVEGHGFLTINSPSGTSYTRNGHLQVSSSGELVTSDGNAILGEQGPMLIPPGTVSVSAEGVVSVNGALVGQLRVVEFDPQATLEERAPGVFVSNSQPKAATNTFVRQGALEAANVNPVESAVELINIQREAEMLHRALSMFHGEMNRVATTELARV